MTRIPIGPTIAHAYRFAFRNGLTVLRAIALPLLAQLVLFFLVLKRAALFLAAAQAQDPSAVTLLGPLLLLFVLVAIFFFAQFTAATEAALGHPPQSWISFPFGKPMWRLMGGFAAALAVIAVIVFLAALLLMTIPVGMNMAIKTVPQNISAGVSLLSVGGVLAVAVFVFVRFLFFLAPVNVSEKQLGVKRAWKLSAGNFWRALLVTLSIAVPAAAVNDAYSLAMAGPPHFVLNAGKEALQASETIWRINELNALASHWYFTLPLMALLMLFQLGAGCAAQVYAWRALTEGEASAPVASD
jgi:hypothetical protein